MITAKEARAQANKHKEEDNEKLLASCSTAIAAAVKDGKFSCLVYMRPGLKLQDTIKLLEAIGYTAEYKYAVDQRDCNSLKISW